MNSFFPRKSKKSKNSLKNRNTQQSISGVVNSPLQQSDKLIFVFQFTDGLYYIKYDHNVFATFNIDDITYYRKGIQPKAVKHMCIPIELLVMISKNEGFPCRM